MKRRQFLNTTTTIAAAAAIPISYAAKTVSNTNTIEEKEKELYEIRTYELKFGGNAKLLINYLKEALQPALKRAGSNRFMLFDEIGNSDPKKIWVLISYPNSASYIKAQSLKTDATFITAAAAYSASEQAIYNRFTSSLLLAFDGLPQMMSPVNEASIFELRTYEGYSEDAVGRKIKMFNKEEIPLFKEVGLNPVFFGEVISGPYRPCLTYLLNFKDMEAHGVAWEKFIASPEWNTMKVKKEYANTVSNIRKVFLKPI